MSKIRLEDIISEVKKSKKYAAVSDATITRVCLETIPKYKKKTEIIKAVKNELHIIHGAFFPEGCHASALSIINNSEQCGKELSRELMALHPSTKERLNVIERFCEFLHPYTENAQSIIDIGCGFNPCAFPFIHTKANVHYIAIDVDSLTLNVIRAYGEREGANVNAVLADVAVEVPTISVDVAFAFKLLPVLEHQKKGLGFELLWALKSRFIVVTYPIKSLSGKEKGMAKYYSEKFEVNLPEGIDILEKEVIGNELVYVVGKGMNN